MDPVKVPGRGSKVSSCYTCQKWGAGPLAASAEALLSLCAVIHGSKAMAPLENPALPTVFTPRAAVCNVYPRSPII